MLNGIVWIRVEGADLYPFLNALRAAGIRCAAQHCKDGVFYARIRYRAYRRMLRTAAAFDVRVAETRKIGLRFYLRRFRKRTGIAIGLLLLSLLLLLGSNVITTIEIYGNETVSTAELELALAEIGIHNGAVIPLLDFRLCEVQMRLAVSDLAWVGIRHTGGRVVVDVAEETKAPEMLHDRIPCNYVATRAAYLTAVTVQDGMELKGIGDSVQVGEVILSGVLEDGHGNLTLHHACGTVIGVYEEIHTFTQPYVEELRTEETAVTKKELSFFGQRVPLFLGEITLTDYGYTESEAAFYLFDRALPIGMVHCTYTPYQYRIFQYSEAEAEALLETQMQRYEQNFHATDVLVSKTVEMQKNETGISCVVSYVFEGEIGKMSEIFIK